MAFVTKNLWKSDSWQSVMNCLVRIYAQTKIFLPVVGYVRIKTVITSCGCRDVGLGFSSLSLYVVWSLMCPKCKSFKLLCKLLITFTLSCDVESKTYLIQMRSTYSNPWSVIDGAKGVYAFANYRIWYGDSFTVDTMMMARGKVLSYNGVYCKTA